MKAIIIDGTFLSNNNKPFLPQAKGTKWLNVWQSQNSKSQPHQATLALLAQEYLENYNKEKSIMNNVFMSSKCPFVFKKSSGNRFSLYFGHNVLSPRSRKFELD